MPREGAKSLIAAVAEAIGREKLNVNDFEDRLLMQKGCFILNEMGVLPRYNFGLYVRGPYSRELADDYYDLLNDSDMEYVTNVPSKYIEELSVLMNKGTPFVEAYATLELAYKHNPRMDKDELIEFVVSLKPHLKKNIEEASGFLDLIPSAI